METKYAYFSALNLYVPLKDNEYFFDDGVRDDLNSYANQIYKRYGLSRKINLGKNVNGVCISISKINRRSGYKFSFFRPIVKKYVHIAYKNDFLEIRAHEEAHALRSLGKLKYLFVEIGRRYGKREMAKTMLKYTIRRITNFGRTFQYDGYIGSAFALCQQKIIHETLTGRAVLFDLALEIMESMYDKEEAFPSSTPARILNLLANLNKHTLRLIVIK
jgi:hypothetical protein